jgi:prophage antirepressor-like protein
MDIIRVAHQTNETWKVDTIMVDGQLWFKGKDVALILGYSDTINAIKSHVRAHQKRKLEELMGGESPPMDYQTKTSIYITSGGLFRLVMRSRMPFAEDFQDWVTDEVLESIRKYGRYDPHGQTALPAPAPSILEQLRIIDDSHYKENHVFNITDESELHQKVVDYIRRFYPHADIQPGLTGLQGRSSGGRLDAYVNGYVPGTCDILITNVTSQHNGLAIELKSPTGRGTIQHNQLLWLERHHLSNYKIVVSNDYDMLVNIINDYFRDVRVKCPFCARNAKHFKTDESLNKHVVGFHNHNRNLTLNRLDTDHDA